MNSFFNTLRNLGPAKLASIAGIAFFLLGFMVYLVASLSSAKMVVLFTELDPSDSKKIVTMLEENRVTYQLKKSGTEILVPEENASRMKIEAAANNLPGLGSNGGYELFDNADALGSTSFVQNINLARALEGELSKTIRSMDNIENARVHLVLPKREMFTREEQKPSASVIIKPKSGKLSTNQVIAIQKLVAAAIPKLEMKNVSIVDSSGKLLTNQFENDEEMQIASNEEKRLDYQRRLTKSLEELIERTVGQGKVRAEVSVEMDFSRVVTNEESFDPDAQVVRSSVTVEDKEKSSEKDPSSVSVSQNMPDEFLNSSEGGTNNEKTRTEETVNYEISKKITNAIRNDGIIKRVSVAVLIDGIYNQDADGKKVYQPRTEKEMELFSALVRSTMGYDPNRGDTAEVVNMQFVDLEDSFFKDPPIFMGFTKDEVIRLSEGLGVALVAILVILLVIRPLINKAFEVSANADEEHDLLEGIHPQLIGQDISEDPLDELIDIAKVEGRVKASSLRKISEIVEKHPEEALSIIRKWMYQES